MWRLSAESLEKYHFLTRLKEAEPVARVPPSRATGNRKQAFFERKLGAFPHDLGNFALG